MLTLSTFPWQQSQWQDFILRHQKACLPHSLLLCGMPGMGKRHFAQACVAALLCQSLEESGIACGSCRACKLYLAGNHLDFLLLSPEDATVIKVDQVRQLVHFTSETPLISNRKLVIIDPTEQMNIAATNALLKTLEEPNGDVVIFLISHVAASLPATILSRCQQVNFNASTEVAKTWLQTQGISGDIDAVLHKVSNAPLVAKALLDGDAWYKDFISDLKTIAASKLEPVTAANKWQKHPLGEILQEFISFVAELIEAQAIGKSPINKSVAPAALFQFYDELIELRQNVLHKINFNVLLLLENLCINCYKLTNKR